MLHITYYILPIKQYILHITYYTLHITYYTLHICDKSSYVQYGTTVIYPISHEIHVQQDAGGYFYISSFMVEEHTFKSHDISYFGKMRPFV